MSKENITIDDLVIMVAKGFTGVQDQITSIQKKVDKGFEEVSKRMDRLDTEIQDLKLRQDNMAYRFELQDLDKRVTHLEKKARFV